MSRENYQRLILTSERTKRARVKAVEKSLPEPTVGEIILAFLRHAQEHYLTPDGKPSD